MDKSIIVNGIPHYEHASSAQDVMHTEADLLEKIKKLEMVGNITAHNLRGAAANIKMLAEVLIEKKLIPGDRSETGDTFTSGEAIQYIYESSISLLDTLSNLMKDVETQLDENIKRDYCDISDTVSHVVNQLNGFIHQRKAIIELDLAIVHISYPKLYLESILYNLISNALKHSIPGTGLKVVISTYTQNGRTILTVKDNGPGIDLAVKGGNLFSFSKTDSLINEDQGIGLYITRTQIESLKGSISVKSTLNEGSEFIVVF